MIIQAELKVNISSLKLEKFLTIIKFHFPTDN